MFTIPRQGAESLPAIPFGHPDINELLLVTGVPYPLTIEALPDIKNHVIDHWLAPKGPADSLQQQPHSAVPQFPVLHKNGLISGVAPARQEYGHLIMDGGSKPVVDYRQTTVAPLIHNGSVKDVTLYGGQRLRFSYDDHDEVLEATANRLRAHVGRWARIWLEQELDKPRNPDNPWERSFATEQEITTLSFLQRYGRNAIHTETHFRDNPTSIHSSIPPATVLAEEFFVHNTAVRVLNGQAIFRSFAGQALPLEESRPSALSMFEEFLALVQPKQNESLLLIAHNPNIYRSWFDLMLGKLATRPDLRLDAAGPAIEANRSYGYVLRAFGRILVNYYNFTRSAS